jgi:hypothetical protein
MREWNMVVGDLVPEVDLFFLQHQRGGNRVHGCVTPTLVEETTILVERREIVNVFLGSQPLQAANLEV